jgi:putative tricarboxylic transport membrane protein
MVPTLVLGIPGSPTAAVIMAAFLIQGLRPGPLLLKDQPILLYSVFFSIIIASLLLFVLGRYITREFAHILKLPYPMLGTLIVALGIVGAYALQNSYYDVLVALIFSVVGYVFDRFHYSSAALILGLILGGIAENSLRQQLIIGDGSWLPFVTRPVSLIILIFTVIALLNPLITGRKKRTGK